MSAPPAGIPAPFVARLRQIQGDAQAAATLDALVTRQRTAAWLNPLYPPGHVPEWLRPLNGMTNLFEGDRARLLAAPEVDEGRLYPVNPSSLLPVIALDVARDMEVLDLAAAPGGKTVFMAGLMGNTGRIAAVEPVKPRFFRLKANLARCRVGNAQLYRADGRGIGRKVPERFDRVLLDAPCSSEARFRRDLPERSAHWSLRKVRETARKQRGLIRSGFAALKPGGRLVYCTCAFAPEENEAVVQHLLDGAPDAVLLDVQLPATVPAAPGLPAFAGAQYSHEMRRAVRVLPDARWDGFFLACVAKAAR